MQVYVLLHLADVSDCRATRLGLESERFERGFDIVVSMTLRPCPSRYSPVWPISIALSTFWTAEGSMTFAASANLP